jgi:hypothetical protein
MKTLYERILYAKKIEFAGICHIDSDAITKVTHALMTRVWSELECLDMYTAVNKAHIGPYRFIIVTQHCTTSQITGCNIKTTNHKITVCESVVGMKQDTMSRTFDVVYNQV